MIYSNVSKRKRNAIRARLNQAIAKHGFTEVRLTANQYFNEWLGKQRLEKDIKEKEEELKRLKKVK